MAAPSAHGGPLESIRHQLLPPLAFKDVKMALRKPRAGLLQLLFLGGLFLVTWAIWPQQGVYSLSAQQAHHLFTVLGIGQLALVALFAPAFTSPAITMEKERNTFDLLYGTRMSAFAIVWGKIVGATAFLMLVVASSVPIVATCLVLGGIDAQSVLWFYVVLVLTALLYGMIGLTVSSLAEKTYISVILTYVVIGVISVAVVIPAMMYMKPAGPTLKNVLHHTWSLSPFVAMTGVVQPDMLLTGSTATELTPHYVIFSWVALVLTVGMVGFLFFQLRKCPAPKPRREQVIDEAITERLSKWPFYLINPRGHRKMIGPMFNPVLIKELRTMLFGRVVYLLRGVYFCLITSVGLAVVAAFGTMEYTPRVIAIFTVSFQMVLILFLAPIFSAPLISSEVESGRFDLLRLTKLRSFWIVSGKFQSVIIPLAILMVATLPPYLALGYIKPDLIPGILRSSCTLVATLVFICSVGMFFSSMSSKTANSVAGTYIVVVLTCVLSLVGLLAQENFSSTVLQRLFVVNPVVTMLSETAMTNLRDEFYLWLPNLKFLLVSTGIMLVATAFRVAMLVRPR